MDPIVTAVASIVTGFLLRSGEAAAQGAQEAVATAARKLANAVLDRLRSDPEERRTVERYEKDPERQRPAIEEAIADRTAADPVFVTQLKELLAEYEQAREQAGVDIRDVGGSVQIGDRNILIDRNTGDVRIGRDIDRD